MAALCCRKALSGNTQSLEKQLGEIQTKLEKLRRHASWLQTQIPFILSIQKDLSWGELPATCQLILDFWKVYASNSTIIKSLVITCFRNAEKSVVWASSLTAHLLCLDESPCVAVTCILLLSLQTNCVLDVGSWRARDRICR